MMLGPLVDPLPVETLWEQIDYALSHCVCGRPKAPGQLCRECAVRLVDGGTCPVCIADLDEKFCSMCGRNWAAR